MGKDTKIYFLLQILRMLRGIEYLAHLDQSAIIFFCVGGGRFAQGCRNGTFLIHMICQVHDVKHYM